MAITLTIGGVNFAPQLKKDSVKVGEQIQNKGNTMTLTIVQRIGQAAPAVGKEIIHKDGSRYLFGGFISRVRPTETGLGQRVDYVVECLDYTYLLINKYAQDTFENATLHDIAVSLLKNVDAGYGLSNAGIVAVGPTVTTVAFNHIPLRKCFEILANLTGYIWRIGYDKTVYFVDPATAPAAPESIKDAASGNHDTLEIVADLSQIRNDIIVLGGTEESANYSQTIKADGTAREWVLVYPVWTMVSMKLNGVVKAFGTDPDPEGASYFMYNSTRGSIHMAAASATPTAGDIIEVIFTYPIDVITEQQSATSIASMIALEGGDGIHSYTIEDTTILSTDQAIQRALKELDKSANPIISGKFTTRTGLLTGGSIFQAGQVLTVNSPTYGINVDTTYIIQKVTTTYQETTTGVEYQYIVEFGGRLFGVVDFLMALGDTQPALPADGQVRKIHANAEAMTISDTVSMSKFTANSKWGAPSIGRFRIKITVDKTKVPADQTGFPVYVDLSTLSPDFFQYVASDGRDIRVTTSDGTTQIPLEVAAINIAAKTGDLFFKGDISSTVNTDFYIYYHNETLTAYARAAALGSDNVWTGCFGVYHATANAKDSSANARDGVFYEASQGAGYWNFPGHVSVAESAATLAGATALPFGKATGSNQRIAQSFVCTSTPSKQIDFLLRKMANVGAPTAGATLRIQADSSGSPSGVDLDFRGGAWNGTGAMTTLNDFIFATTSAITLTAGTTYWLVMSYDIASDTNYPNIAYDPTGTYGVLKQYNGTTWTTVPGSLRFKVYKSGGVNFVGSALSMSTQNMQMTVRLKKTDTAYESLLSNGSASTSHLEVNGTTNDMRWRPATIDGIVSIGTGVTNTGDGTWRNYCWRLNATNQSLLVNGAVAGTGTVNTLVTTQNITWMGLVQQRLNGTYGQALNGLAKFIRIRPAQTDQFNATESNNLDSPATFYAVTAPELFENTGVWNLGQWN